MITKKEWREIVTDNLAKVISESPVKVTNYSTKAIRVYRLLSDPTRENTLRYYYEREYANITRSTFKSCLHELSSNNLINLVDGRWCRIPYDFAKVKFSPWEGATYEMIGSPIGVAAWLKHANKKDERISFATQNT